MYLSKQSVDEFSNAFVNFNWNVPTYKCFPRVKICIT